jgi:hypothetical protein
MAKTQQLVNPHSVSGTGSNSDPYTYIHVAHMAAGLDWADANRKGDAGWHNLVDEAKDILATAHALAVQEFQVQISHRTHQLFSVVLERRRKKGLIKDERLK